MNSQERECHKTSATCVGFILKHTWKLVKNINRKFFFFRIGTIPKKYVCQTILGHVRLRHEGKYVDILFSAEVEACLFLVPTMKKKNEADRKSAFFFHHWLRNSFEIFWLVSKNRYHSCTCIQTSRGEKDVW